MVTAFPDPPQAVEAIMKLRIREAESWRDKQYELIDAASDRHKRLLADELAGVNEEVRDAIRSRIIETYTALYASEPAVRRYVSLRPERSALFANKGCWRRPHGAPEESPFREDYREIVNKMMDVGLDIRGATVWSDGLVLHGGKYIRAGDLVSVERIDEPDVIVRGQVTRIARNEMCIVSSGRVVPTMIYPDDLSRGCVKLCLIFCFMTL